SRFLASVAFSRVALAFSTAKMALLWSAIASANRLIATSHAYTASVFRPYEVFSSNPFLFLPEPHENHPHPSGYFSAPAPFVPPLAIPESPVLHAATILAGSKNGLLWSPMPA